VTEKPIVIFDTQLILRATINRRSLPRKLLFELQNQYRLAVSLEIIAEVQDVLNRPELRTKFRSLTDDAVEETLVLLTSAEQFSPSETPPASRDPKDDKFLALAAECKAQYLVSEDKDLLVLDPYQNTRILNALNFLHELTQEPPVQGTDSTTPTQGDESP
jgi:uncharacterized protein